MVDTNPMDPTSFSTTPPAAPLSAEDIKEMRARWARVVADVPVGAMDNSERGERLGHLIGSDMYRLLDALEALTAENARLTAYSRHQYSLGYEAAAVEIGGEIDVLKAERDKWKQVAQYETDVAQAEIEGRKAAETENARLKKQMEIACAFVERGSVRAWNDTHHRTEPLSADRKRVIETHDMFRQAMDLLNPDAAETEAAMQELADLGQAMQPELYTGAKEERDPASDWSGDEYDDVTSRTLRNLSNPEFMAAAFGEQDGDKEAAE